jgi:hypothetical protein
VRQTTSDVVALDGLLGLLRPDDPHTFGGFVSTLVSGE